jgi:FkbM family methyltransferase
VSLLKRFYLFARVYRRLPPIYILRKHLRGELNVVHVGSHLAQERISYRELNIQNVLWVEANPSIFPDLQLLVGPQNCSNSLVWSECDKLLEFRISSNEVSSSIFNFDNTNTFFGDLRMVSSIQIRSRSLDCLLNNEFSKILENPYCLILDIQGAEYEALLGCKVNLKRASAIIVEVSKKKIYENSSDFRDVDLLLRDSGFRLLCDFTDIHTGHGDCLYFRSSEISALLRLYYKFLRSLRYLIWFLEILERRRFIRLGNEV